MRISSPGKFRQNSWRGSPISRDDVSGLCLILDQDLLRVSAEQAMTRALDAGVRFFQYRNKNGPRKFIYEESLRLAKMAAQADALFVVNDHADIARAVGAGGVHVGQDDLPAALARRVLGSGKIIGVSTHSIDEARAAVRDGADYIGFGPMFATATKDAGAVQGARNLRMIRDAVRIPIVAIGGINYENVREVLLAGADAAAVISAVLATDDIRSACERMVRTIDEVRRGPSE